MRDAELAGVVCARICHDLANPVGAILNGADLIREIGAAEATQELRLLDQSARRAAALLRLHRIAFGVQRDREAVHTHGQLHDWIAAVLSRPRVTLNWNAPRDGEFNAAAARLMALMVLAGRAMLGMAGEVTLRCPADATLPLSVSAQGPKVTATDQQRGWLAGTSAALPDSRHVEFALIPAALSAVRARLDLAEEIGRVTMTALPC